MLNTFFQNTPKQILTKYYEIVKKINDLEPSIAKLSDEQIRVRAQDLKYRKQLNNGNVDIFEAFAIAREATKRVLNMRHFDTQLIGGLVLHEGKIAEMKTGEGKTIVAILPAFLNALSGKSVHVVTVNDYLARRDAESIGQVYKFLGLSVGLIQENMEPSERKKNYNCDVVYVTNNELGFDYLRDNMAFTKDEIVLTSLSYCIVDEVDSILIDEARTPLIISGPSDAPTEKYIQTSKLAKVLQKNVHYTVDEKNQNVTLTENGTLFCEQALRIPDLYNLEDPWISYVLNSLKAKELFKLSTHYIVNENQEVIIVDEFTGRTMVGRRWSDGLHQAIEAKENLPIQNESQTLASITYQNLFLLYEKLSGMTGTAKTEEIEFEKIYSLKVVPIPTNRPLKRKDFPDLIYKNQYLKWKAVANECLEMNALGRPVLIGTTTIEKSELLASLLREYDVSYRLLNARPENVESESEIVAQAGCQKAITISTNMAGRGTDITLGGRKSDLLISANLKELILSLNESNFIANLDRCMSKKPSFEKIVNFLKAKGFKWFNENSNDILTLLSAENSPVDPLLVELQKIIQDLFEKEQKNLSQEKNFIMDLGGLHVIGTERHESRRIDNQLRGRSGRQGDPGSSRFFLSLDDKLLRLFGGDKIFDMMQNIGLQDDTPIQSSFLNSSLESAQKKVEAYYFDSRKQLFEYDQALTLQRNNIYRERSFILEQDNLRSWVQEYGIRSLADISKIKGEETNSDFCIFLSRKIQNLLGIPYKFNLLNNVSDASLLNFQFVKQQYRVSLELKEIQMEAVEAGLMRELEKSFLLQQIDFSWKGHLQRIALLKDSIKWRAYGQRNPLTDYKKESFNIFIKMVAEIRHLVLYFILRSRILLES